MASKGYILLGLLVLLGSFSYSNADDDSKYSPTYGISSFNRSNFPTDFIFGTAASSYQYEGAANERGQSMWDYYTHKYPEKIADGSNGDVAVNQYHLYKDDIKRLMKNMGADAYRFSISWPRILPTGKLSDGVNETGVAYYNNLIDELIFQNLKPFATIFHWDIPQTLEDEYGGFLSEKVVDDFRDFADVCFQRFGDRVKHWITINEPWTYSNGGYGVGILAPFRCSSFINPDCIGGDSGVEPYNVSHHLLLAHAAAVQLYKTNKTYQEQKGVIGMTNVCYWMVPYSNSTEDQAAALRALDFMCGWFMDPMTTGDYPESMRTLVGTRLPNFTNNQSEMLKGSYDFIGLNYYTANYAADAPSIDANKSYTTDGLVNQTTSRDGIPIGPPTASPWLFIYPSGLRDLLNYTKYKYNDPDIYITENGVSDNKTSGLVSLLHEDHQRIEYYYGHLSYLNMSIGDGVKVKGYFAWSLMDNYEWNSGYTVGFGLYFVNFNDHALERTPKYSAIWFRNFLQK